MSHIAVSITTINVPMILKDLEDNRIRYKHNPVLYIVTGDKKTDDKAVEDFIETMRVRSDSDFVYLSVRDQDEFLTAIDARAFKRAMPYNTVGRRNIGDLYAYTQGCQIIIRVDDDNFPILTEDFFTGHSITGEKFRRVDRMVAAENGWFNPLIHLYMQNKNSSVIYPRGYPYEERKPANVHFSSSMARIMLNQGLWIGAPDVDAVTWLENPELVATIQARDFDDHAIVLRQGTWCPVNTQNTSFHRSLLPAFFACPYHLRFDDIYGGYMVRRLMDEKGDLCRYGSPFVNQKRNPHNTYRDIELELFGMRNCAEYVNMLRLWAPAVKADSYLEMTIDILDHISDCIGETIPHPDDHDTFLKGIELTQLWCETIATIDKEGVTIEQSDRDIN